jgi:redox-sensitive bicupin YhaK (pirin superfamily)
MSACAKRRKGWVSPSSLPDQGAAVRFERAELSTAPGRKLYVHVARGSLTANRSLLSAGDALQITDGRGLVIEGGKAAEVLVFELP